MQCTHSLPVKPRKKLKVMKYGSAFSNYSLLNVSFSVQTNNFTPTFLTLNEMLVHSACHARKRVIIGWKMKLAVSYLKC